MAAAPLPLELERPEVLTRQLQQLAPLLWCHGTRYVRHARGRYVYKRCPELSVRTARRRLVRVAGTYSTGAPGRRCQHSIALATRTRLRQARTTQSDTGRTGGRLPAVPRYAVRQAPGWDVYAVRSEAPPRSPCASGMTVRAGMTVRRLPWLRHGVLFNKARGLTVGEAGVGVGSGPDRGARRVLGVAAVGAHALHH